MSSLRSEITAIAAIAVTDLSDEDLDAEVVEIHRASLQLQGRLLDLVSAARRRRFFQTLGYASATSWLADRLGTTFGAAGRTVGLSRALPSMPLTRRALADGDIDLPRVHLLAGAFDRNPEAFSEGEKALVEAAREVPAARFRHVVEYWKQAADLRRWETEQVELHSHRRLHVSPTFAGTVRVDGELDPEGGQMLIAALRAHTERAALDPSDGRNPAQVRADALIDICRDHLDRADVPVAGGERPHLTVLVDLSVLEGSPGRAELSCGSPITGEAARRIACDASVCRIITRGPSEPLDVGRRTRVVSPALRRALEFRDGGCRAPGCDRPPRWCDAHHIIPWALGGPTSLANLCLLCRWHHRMVHDGELSLQRRE